MTSFAQERIAARPRATGRGAAALAARARRVTRIRRRVIASTLAAFALAWGVIAWDGSMGAESAATTSEAAAATDPVLPAETPALTTRQS